MIWSNAKHEVHMAKISDLNSFLHENTIQLPVIIPLSVMAGYSICGTKCAGISAITSIFDIGLKYFEITDGYYITFTALSGIMGHKMSTPIVEKFNMLTLTYASLTGKPYPETISDSSLENLEIGCLSKIVVAGMSAIGMIAGEWVSKIETCLLNINQFSSSIPNQSNENVETNELVTHDDIINPEL